MARKGKLPAPVVVAKMLRNGWTYEMVGREFGVTANAVWRQQRRAGHLTPTVSYRELLPWEKVEPEHQRTNTFRSLTSLERIERGLEVEGKKRRDALALKRRLEASDVVVHYDPRIPPNPHSEVHGGFVFVKREPGDGKYTRNPNK